MNYRALFVVFLSALFLAGCGSMPKTPDLLVENAKGGKMFSEKDTFEVKQSLASVTAVLKGKLSECFKKQIEVNYWQYGTYHHDVYMFTPKLSASKEKARLTLQKMNDSVGTANLGGMPPEGWYMMVVDAYPVDKGTTRVETYFQDTDNKNVFTAVKAWMTGTNTGCPDLTK